MHNKPLTVAVLDKGARERLEAGIGNPDLLKKSEKIGDNKDEGQTYSAHEREITMSELDVVKAERETLKTELRASEARLEELRKINNAEVAADLKELKADLKEVKARHPATGFSSHAVREATYEGARDAFSSPMVADAMAGTFKKALKKTRWEKAEDAGLTALSVAIGGTAATVAGGLIVAAITAPKVMTGA